MAEAAYQVAHQRHDPKTIVADMLDKYAVIIEEKKTAGRREEDRGMKAGQIPG